MLLHDTFLNFKHVNSIILSVNFHHFHIISVTVEEAAVYYEICPCFQSPLMNIFTTRKRNYCPKAIGRCGGRGLEAFRDHFSNVVLLAE